MQGLESLNQFQKFISTLGGLGRFEDTYMIHAAEGETVVPMEVLDRNPLLKKRLFKSMRALGIDPGRYIVGNDLNSLNPLTGQPEFFFKKIFKRIKKGLGDVAGYAAPIVGAMYGPGWGALAGAGLGAFKRENPGDPSQWAQMAGRGAAAGMASNIASGQGAFLGKGARGIYSPDAYMNPWDLGKKMIGSPMEFLKKDDKYRFMEKYFPGTTPIDATGAFNTEYESILNSPAGKKVLENLGHERGIDKIMELATISAKTKGQSLMGGMSFTDMLGLYAAGTIGLGALIDMTSEDVDVGPELQALPEGVPYQGILNPQLTYANPNYREGGILDLQGGGESRGPGTGTSDSIPAMLSDGEFVMTADAVRGAGGGNRREGARKMYEAMDRLEARA